MPANLHVIGTMNSADRNIALVDHALRRRFEFVEVPPDPALLGAVGASGVDLRRLLTTLNERIAFLLDRDHCIGHGYFLGCKTDLDVVTAFAKRLLPLLAETSSGTRRNCCLLSVTRPDRRTTSLRQQLWTLVSSSYLASLQTPLWLSVIGAAISRASLTINPRFWNAMKLVPWPRRRAIRSVND